MTGPAAGPEAVEVALGATPEIAAPSHPPDNDHGTDPLHASHSTIQPAKLGEPHDCQ